MFVFKGTLAADSLPEDEPEWRMVDHYNIQNLRKPAFATMLQPAHHQRNMTEDIKRPSLLQLRSRSYTSFTSGRHTEAGSLSPASTIEKPSPRSSTDWRSFNGGPYHRPSSSESFSKALVAKGSRLWKRQHSKDLTSLQPLDWPEEAGRGDVQELSNRPRSRHSRLQPQSEDNLLPWSISEPFNFQHLTHTTRHHVRRLEDTNHDDLISEFSAIRASQAPQPELRGIKAAEIQRGCHFSDTPSDTSSPPRTAHGLPQSSSPDRIHNPDRSHIPDAGSPGRGSQLSRSVEKLAPTSPAYHTAQTSPISPPPRSSSRNAVPEFFTFHQDSPTDTSFEPYSPTRDNERFDYPSSNWHDGIDDFSQPHAVTTPDDTAHSMRPLPFSMVRTELTGVPEEDEMTETKRSSSDNWEFRPTTPTPDPIHNKCSLCTKISPLRWSGTLPQVHENDDDHSCTNCRNSNDLKAAWKDDLSEDVPVSSRVSRFISFPTEESWEDAIDYCYEHAAEADCEFDWECVSPEEVKVEDVFADVSVSDSAPAPEHTLQPNNASGSPICGMNKRQRTSSVYSNPPPALLPIQTSLPDFDLPSATSTESSFSSIPEAITPLATHDSSEPAKAHVGSLNYWSEMADSLAIASNDLASEFVQEDLYQQIFAGKYDPDNHSAFNVGRIDGSTIENSPRSSRFTISKSSSQESFWAGRRHRNTSSNDSLPDLIPSKSSREGSIPTLDSFADQVAALSVGETPLDPHQTIAQRRRSPNLAAAVVQKSILSKVIAAEDRVSSLSVNPALRSRANSDATSPVNDSPLLPPLPSRVLERRLRSISSASSLKSSPAAAKTAGYSLFPAAATR